MAVEKGKSGKWLRYILSFAMIFVFVTIVTGCRQDDGDSGQLAQTALNKLLSNSEGHAISEYIEDFCRVLSEFRPARCISYLEIAPLHLGNVYK